MKKLLVLIMALALIASAQVVMADPGPYTAAMASDSLDDEGGPDGTPTPRNSNINPIPAAAPETPQVWEAIEHVLVNNGPGTLGLNSNSDTDALQVLVPHSYWYEIAPAAQSGDFAVISITAANTNTLGVYKFGDPGNVQWVVPPQNGFQFLGDGSAGNPYPGGVNPYPNDNFGFALSSTPQGGGTPTVWYSDPALNTADQLDHMLAFHLPQLDGYSVYIDTTGDGNQDKMVDFSADTYVLAWEDLPEGNDWFDSDYNDTIFLVTRVTPIPEPMSMLLLGSGLLGLVGLRRKVS